MKVTFIVGPTATGKSALALELCLGKKSAIVNCDSVQAYQGLEIGAAQPSREELAKVPHYLYSYIPKGGKLTAGQYCRDFYDTMAKLESSCDEVFVVGGTGFYFQAIEKGIYEIGAAQSDVRDQIEDELEVAGGPERYHAELTEKDPEAAKRISVNDHYRLARAIEMIRVHGKSVTQIQSEFAAAQKPFPWPLTKIGVTASREVLEKRIRLRTQKMIQQGLIEEVKGLVAEGLSQWEPMRSVGYRETLEYLNANGSISRETLMDTIVQNTLKLTKKQKTWFKRDLLITWTEIQA